MRAQAHLDFYTAPELCKIPRVWDLHKENTIWIWSMFQSTTVSTPPQKEPVFQTSQEAHHHKMLRP